MSKYANLPDIDASAPDVYETEDVPSPVNANKDDSSDDEAAQKPRGGKMPVADADELDKSNLMGATEAGRRFRKAERLSEQRRAQTRYTYPPSPTEDDPARQPSAAYRIKQLQAELASLESELEEGDPGEDEEDEYADLLTGLVDVRERLEKMGKAKSKSKVVEVVSLPPKTAETGSVEVNATSDTVSTRTSEKPATQAGSVAEMDRRVGRLEELVGSSGATLDETSPMTPPLLPLLTKLNGQITLLTQPRHIDSISRRLKLLLSDLDRVGSHPASKRQGTAGSGHAYGAGGSGPTTAPTHAEQLGPLLTRLGPALPQIPHVLARLRTLAALHTAAGDFEQTLSSLESEQRRERAALEELSAAVGEVEKSLETNRTLVEGNIKGLEERIGNIAERLEKLET